MSDIRSYATPVTIGAFFLIALTGLMMFLEMDYGLIKPAHEYLSLLFLIGAGLHIQGNWKVFKRYFTLPLARRIMTAFAVLIVIAFLPIGGGKGSPKNRISKLVSSLPVETVASALEESPERLVESLRQRGIKVEGTTETLSHVASANGRDSMDILREVLE